MAVIIAVDARTIFSETRRGTGKNLLDAYRVLAGLRPEWRLVMYHRRPGGPNPFERLGNVRTVCMDMPGDRWHLWEQVLLPWTAGRQGAALLHCPANSCPRFSPVPLVSTIHDLVPLKLSDGVGGPDASLFKARLQRCLKQSARIIAVSTSTKQDLIAEFGADPRRIDVVGWAADSGCRNVLDEAELAGVRARYRIAGRYILAFSGRSVRKNAEGMIRGYARLDGALRRAVHFVVVGVHPPERCVRLTELIRRCGVDGQCRVHGFATERDIAALLSGADVLAFCSLYEGFGLPILDAFRCETAVLTANISSMPEVAGDAAMYCEPTDPASIGAGMSRLLTDAALRKALVDRGRRRLLRYSWEETAQSMCQVFEKCLKGVPQQR